MTWQERALGDCVTFASGGTPNKGKPEYWSGEIPWVSSGEMSRHFIEDTSLHITEAGAEAGSRLVPAGTVFAVVRGMSLATEFRLACAARTMAFNQDVKALTVRDGIDSYFLFSSLRAHANQIRDLSTEAAHGTKKLEMERLASFRIPVPEVGAQRRAADVVRNYDDLIESNRRRITLLQESARLLYREWFVNLRFPGYQLVSMVDGLPEKWHVTKYGDILDAIGGATPSTKRLDYWDGDVVWLTPTDVTRNDCLYLPASTRKITEAGYASCSTVLLPAGTIFMTSRASIGYFALLDQPACTNQGFIAIVPKLSNTRNFLLLNLMSRVDEFEAMATGSTFKELGKKTFREMRVLMPSQEVLDAFEAATLPIIEQVTVLKKQIVALTRARDELLPKLMSGAIQV